MNKTHTVYASKARTATPDPKIIPNLDGSGVVVVIDVTAINATPSVTPTIQGVDPVSGKKYTLLTGAAITGVGTTVLKVFPAATAAANTVANDIVPAEFTVDMAHLDADSITYSVSASVI